MYQRAAAVTGTRMHDEPGGLVDHNEIVVFEDDLQIHRLSGEPAGLGGRKLPGEAVAWAKAASGTSRSVVEPDVAFGDQPLNPASAQVRQKAGEVLVESIGGGWNGVLRRRRSGSLRLAVRQEGADQQHHHAHGNR